jgi:hypothetical protein
MRCPVNIFSTSGSRHGIGATPPSTIRALWQISLSIWRTIAALTTAWVQASRSRTDGREIAEKPSRQIDEVDPLIDQLTAAGDFRVGAPFLLVAHTTTVSVSGPHEHQRTESTGIDKLPRLPDGGVIPMVESHADSPIRSTGRVDKRRNFPCRTPRRFLDENMFARVERGVRNRRERIVGRRDDYDIHVGSRCRRRPRVCRLGV